MNKHSKTNWASLETMTDDAIDISDTFATTYPTIARFLQTTGTIKIGHHHNFPVTSFIRALVEDNLVWESADDYPTFDAALADLEAGLGEWLREMG